MEILVRVIMNKKIFAVIINAILLIAVLPILPAQTVYKWVDENGRVHYGEHPPQTHTKLDELSLEAAPANKTKRPIPRFKYTPAKSNNKKKKKSQILKQKRAAVALAKKCAKYQEKYDHTTSKMRTGYTAKQYDGLEKKRRHYRKQLRLHCR